MQERSFSIKQALSIGWRTSWHHARFLFRLFLLWLTYIIIFWVMGKIVQPVQSLGVVIKLIDSVLKFLIGLGFIRIYYEIYTFGQSSYEQLYKGIRYAVTFILAALAVMAFFVGWVLMSSGVIYGIHYTLAHIVDIPSTDTTPLLLGICIALATGSALVALTIIAMFIFVPTTIISGDASKASAALTMSRAITKGHRVKLLLFMGLTILLEIFSLGFLTSVIALAWMHVYKRLKEIHN